MLVCAPETERSVEKFDEIEDGSNHLLGYDVSSSNQNLYIMFGWALVFFIVALIAGLLGFTGIAVSLAGIAKIIFYIALVLLVISFLVRALQGKSVL